MHGPAFLHQRAEGGAIALALNAPLSRADASFVPAPVLDDAVLADGAIVASAEVTPDAVQQVWVATRVSQSDKWTLKSAQNTFLGCDKYGDVHAENEARGPQEEWSVKRVDVLSNAPADADVVAGPRRGFALQSTHGGWLALETSADGKRRVRADVPEVTGACVWDASVQWKYRHDVRTQSKREKRATGEVLGFDVVDEDRISRSRQGWNAGTRSLRPQGERGELEKAQREGRLSEAMLDRRVKLKSDKYAR